MSNSFNNQYKIAVDLGTTTIELAIIDNLGTLIATDYFLNPQKLYGKDVINRINSAIRDRMFIKIMKDMIKKSLKLSIMTILSDKEISVDSISAICICGNTTMISILLEYDLEELGTYPFNHRLKSSVILNSRELFYNDFPINCNVLLSGCASAFIGGDVLAGLIALKGMHEFHTNKPYIFLDLGTNGEMVLYDGKTYFTTSCACGPAFESSVRCSNSYGSNLIDAITMGIKSGKISKDGILHDSYIENGVNILGINVSADLLRDIMVAKSAIRTGIDILLDESDISPDNICNVFIAGGFGFHINIDNSIYIGLIPSCFKNKIHILGNTSLKGAIELLNYPFKIKQINQFAKENFRLIQMANLPDYQDKLIKNMHFKE